MLRLTIIFLFLTQYSFGQLKYGLYSTKVDTLIFKGFVSVEPPNDVTKYVIGDTSKKTRPDTSSIKEAYIFYAASLELKSDGTFNYHYAPSTGCLTWRDWKGNYTTEGNELHLSISDVAGMYRLIYTIEGNKLKFLRKQKEPFYETIPMSEGELTYSKYNK